LTRNFFKINKSIEDQQLTTVAVHVGSTWKVHVFRVLSRWLCTHGRVCMQMCILGIRTLFAAGLGASVFLWKKARTIVGEERFCGGIDLYQPYTNIYIPTKAADYLLGLRATKQTSQIQISPSLFYLRHRVAPSFCDSDSLNSTGICPILTGPTS
jgi:hypothetical protein